MHNTLSHTTHRRWAIFYAAAAALLAGWLLLEKMPDGREELAGSVEGAFRRSWEVMKRSNRELLQAIQDGAEDYPSPQAEDYAKRAEKALVLAAAFENLSGEDGAAERLSVLKDSLILLADRDEICQKGAEEFIGAHLTNHFPENYKSLITNQLLLQSQGLSAFTLNYCAQKITGDCGFTKWIPVCQSSVLTPAAGEPFQAEIFLAAFWTPVERRCATTTAFFNDQPLPLREGIAAIRTTFPTPGQHTLRLRFRRERCRDGSVTELSRDFQVNVLAKCAEE